MMMMGENGNGIVGHSCFRFCETKGLDGVMLLGAVIFHHADSIWPTYTPRGDFDEKSGPMTDASPHKSSVIGPLFSQP